MTSPPEIFVFVITFVVGSSSGMANLLLSGRRWTRRIVAGTLLYYGLTGMAITAYQLRNGYSQENIMLAFVGGIVIGLTGLSVLDAITWMQKKFGVTEVRRKGDDDE